LSVLDVSEVCFIYVFRTHVAIVVIWMLHMFHTYVARVLFGCCVWLQWFSSVFFKVFKKHVSSVSTAFRRILQLLYFDVSKVNRVLHLFSSYLLLHHLSRSQQGMHSNEGWAMGVGLGSCVRRVQAKELRTDGRCLRSGMGAGRRGLRTSWLEAGAQARDDVGAAGALSYCAGAVDAILFRFT
jgi:hypothetical protein